MHVFLLGGKLFIRGYAERLLLLTYDFAFVINKLDLLIVDNIIVYSFFVLVVHVKLS